MKITHLKLFLSMAIVVGIANVDSTAATKIASINIDADISAIGINAKKSIITNNFESNLINIGQTIEAVNVIKAKAVNPSIVAANILPTAARPRIIASRVTVRDIDIQASLPIIL